MSVALIEPFEMTATLNVVVSINSTTVIQTYWTASKKSAGTKNHAALFVVRKTLQTGILLKWQKYCLCGVLEKLQLKLQLLTPCFYKFAGR